MCKKCIFRSFLAIFGFLSAPKCSHWPFIGLNHFYNLPLYEPVKKIGLICLINQFFLILKRFCQFWSFLVIILTSTGPVFNSRVEFFAVISPLHSTQPIWVEKLPLGGKNFIIFHLILKMCKKMHFRSFLAIFRFLLGPLTLPLAIYWSRSLLELTTVWTSKKNWLDLPNW